MILSHHINCQTNIVCVFKYGFWGYKRLIIFDSVPRELALVPSGILKKSTATLPTPFFLLRSRPDYDNLFLKGLCTFS